MLFCLAIRRYTRDQPLAYYRERLTEPLLTRKVVRQEAKEEQQAAMSMSAEDTEAFRRIIAADSECKQCFECAAPNPQWCDISHGIFLCLECSGVHRSLGVHLSFVRSCTMDNWTSWRPEKLRQMQLGGNRRARLYFQSHSVPTAPIKARYESEGALKYASMLEAEALGKPFNEALWRPPEWYTNMKAQQQQAGSTQGSYNGYASPTQSSPTGGVGVGSMENRFTGIGSSPAPARSPTGVAGGSGAVGGGDWLSTVASGWGALTQKASEIAHTAQERIGQADIDDMKSSLSRGWTSMATTVASYAKPMAMEGDGLTALQEHARKEREAQPQQPAAPGRFDHIEHVASPPQQPQHSNSTVASGWGSPTNGVSSPPSRVGNAWSTSSLSPIGGAGNTPTWGVTTAVTPSTPSTANSSKQPETVLSGRPVPRPQQMNRKKNDDWGWDDE